ncbi:MAG: ion channel [Pseudomonadales bacterium]
MLYATILSFVLLLSTIIIHFWALRGISDYLCRCSPQSRVPVLVAMMAIFLAHLTEVSLYAVAYSVLEHSLLVGELSGTPGDTPMDYFYYSIVMYTSLGLGDVVPVGHLKIISGIEALNGLVLIGWSTSFTFLAMRRFWPLDATTP